MIQVGMILAGCGMYDGSDPQETVLLLHALGRRGARVHALAPDMVQLHVVDHRNGNESDGRRGVLAEAARLCRGAVAPLDAFDPRGADALVIPGGYGVGKHLMTGFAVPGQPVATLPAVDRLLRHFLESRKPVGAVSLARLLLEAVVPEPFTEHLRDERAERCYEDHGRRLLYAPGFLAGDRITDVATGIDALAERLVTLCAEEEG